MSVDILTANTSADYVGSVQCYGSLTPIEFLIRCMVVATFTCMVILRYQDIKDGNFRHVIEILIILFRCRGVG